MDYNQVIPRDGCQFYVVPAGGFFNISNINGNTQLIETAALWVLAVNCNLTSDESGIIYHRMKYQLEKGPFRSSLAPLMIVMSLCMVSSVIILAVLGIIRRTPRPWPHKLVLVYVSILLSTLFGYLHQFSREEHIKGFESTDTFIVYFFASRRCIALFLPSVGFILCEAHILASIMRDPGKKRLIVCLFGVLLVLDTVWWVAGVCRNPIFDEMTRRMNWCIRVWFYIELLCHFVYFVTFGWTVYSLWRYAFSQNNRAIGVLSLVTSVIPFLSMLITAIVRGCFVWSLPLSMVTRAVGLLILWDWKVAITQTMLELERDDTIGRLVSEQTMLDQFKELKGSGGAHGTLSHTGLVEKLLGAIKYPKSLLTSLNILEIRTADTEVSDSHPPHFVAGEEANTSSAGAATPQKSEGVTRYPVHKHTVRVVDQASTAASGASAARSTRTRPSTRPPSPANSVLGAPLGSAVASAQASTVASVSVQEEPGVPEELAEPEYTRNHPSSPVPGPSVSAPMSPLEPPAEDEELPQFVPHPGFRTGDYNNEKS